MSKKKKKIQIQKPDPHPLFKPRMIWGQNSNGVSVVRIPEEADPYERRQALSEARHLAGQYSDNNPLYW